MLLRNVDNPLPLLQGPRVKLMNAISNISSKHDIVCKLRSIDTDILRGVLHVNKDSCQCMICLHNYAKNYNLWWVHVENFLLTNQPEIPLYVCLLPTTHLQLEKVRTGFFCW